MSRDNRLWGAPWVHGELLKLGIAVDETSAGKYMVRCVEPRSQTWWTFVDNHVKTMVSVDFFTVPTIRFQVLYVFVVLAHDRRRILLFAVTAHSAAAKWTAQQLRKGFPWDTAPRSLLRDRDRIFGKDVMDQVKAMGIKQVLSAPRPPWQRACVERVIGTIHREWLDHVIVFGEGVTCKVSWTTLIGPVRTWDWRRTLQFLARSNRRTWGGLFPCGASAACIIVMSAVPHKGIFGAIPSARICALAPPH